MSHDRGHGVYTMTPVVLGHPTGGPKLGVPGGDQESLELTNCGPIATTTGSVDALLELEDRPFDSPPWDVWPCIHRRGLRVHAVWTPLGPSTIHTTGLTSAYPRAFPEALAF